MSEQRQVFSLEARSEVRFLSTCEALSLNPTIRNFQLLLAHMR